MSADATIPNVPYFGPAPATDELAAARQRAAERVTSAKAQLAATSVSPDVAALMIGVASRDIVDLVANGTLVFFHHEGRTLIPSWQVHNNEPLPGIAQLAGLFCSTFNLSQWATHPDPALGGRTPAQMLADGHVDRVVAVARHRT